MTSLQSRCNVRRRVRLTVLTRAFSAWKHFGGCRLYEAPFDRRVIRRTQKAAFGRLFPNCSLAPTQNPGGFEFRSGLWAEIGHKPGSVSGSWGPAF